MTEKKQLKMKKHEEIEIKKKQEQMKHRKKAMCEMAFKEW
jgi:hypothetical protein